MSASPSAIFDAAYVSIEATEERCNSTIREDSLKFSVAAQWQRRNT